MPNVTLKRSEIELVGRISFSHTQSSVLTRVSEYFEISSTP